MVDEKTNKIINELLEELKQEYPDFRGIYLFGSRARGDYNEYSDYDLAIIFNNQKENYIKKSIRSKINKLMVKYDVIIDNPFLSYYDLIKPITPLRENIKKEGIFYGTF